jgi:cell division protein FtsW (lipid II flippase)
MYTTTDVGNIAVWCMILFGLLALAGAKVGGMILALFAVFVVACILHK